MNGTGLMFPTFLLLHNYSLNYGDNSVVNSPRMRTDLTVCYGIFGCYTTTDPWTSARRPIALLPEPPEELDVSFVIFNGRNRSYPQYLNKFPSYLDLPDSISSTDINPRGMIYFITHGFLEKGATKWIEKMMNALLDMDADSTVIVIDWGKGSNPPYNQACANIRLVGNIVGHFIYTMMGQLGLQNLDNVHMIGHSLGSHLSGYTGTMLRDTYNLTLGRITGLDPAELAFTETDTRVRLDPGDAKFVDIVHSDATPFVPKIGLGLLEPIGHVDFYPNGGFNQPGCERNFWKDAGNHRFVSSVFQFFSCSHSRSYLYFTESIRHPMRVVSCDTYEGYNAGECFDCGARGSHCIEFGMNSVHGYRRLVRERQVSVSEYRPIELFFLTNSYAPFLTPNFRITIKIADGKESVEHGPEIGKIFLYIDGRDDKIYFNEVPTLFEPGQNYSKVITGRANSEPTAISIGWEYETNLLNPLTWRLLTSPRVYIEYVELQTLAQSRRVKMCQATHGPITNNELGVLAKTILWMANHEYNNSLINVIHNQTLSADSNKTSGEFSLAEDVRCYGVYGCFPITPPWIDEKRPVAYHPQSPATVDVRYPVFTKPNTDHPKFIDINDPASVRHLGINPKGRIYFITHGYIESGDRPWIRQMVNALIENDPDRTASCVVIDWRKASNPPYTQTCANIRLIGAITAHVIYLLYEELNMKNLDKVHLLGHSLGSHLCGYAGYHLQKDFGLKLGRITGLDPAEPLFSDTDPLVRLDRSDAKFVDVIHSDGSEWVSKGGLGMYQPIGHVDFYPNGGYNQPGCSDPMNKFIRKHDDSFFWGFQEFFGCNHLRCHQFLTDSILHRCPFVGIGCESYAQFLRGECFECDRDGHYCVEFGLKAQESYSRLIENGVIKDPNAPLSVYMITGAEPPYCRSHFRITMSVSDEEESLIHGGEIGKMSFELHGEGGVRSGKMDFSKDPVYFEPGGNYSAIMAGSHVAKLLKVMLTWEYRTNPLNPLTWRLLVVPRVYVQRIRIQLMEQRTSVVVCPLNDAPVRADQENEFKSEYCRS
uniref:Lipase domain-containing protein n=1 Tax=Anopheles melas TaxID=34690 RepID=A0A182UI44_9DIPT